MRTMAPIAAIGLVTAVGSVTIAFLQASPSVPLEAEWAATGLAQLDVDRVTCDPSLPEGPGPEALHSRLRAVTPQFMPCLKETRDVPAGTLHLSITIDCTGSPSRIEVVDEGDWPDDVVACARDVLRAAHFPAHGASDGYTFEFPVRYTGR